MQRGFKLVILVTLILNTIVFAQTYPNDTYFNAQWGLNNTDYPGMDINAKSAWELFKGSNTISVYIIENGVLVNPTPGLRETATGHPDLNNKASHIADWHDRFIINDTIISGHGTAVAGIIGAQTNNDIGIAGIDADVRINQVGGGSCGFNNIDEARSLGAEIINMSWRDLNGWNIALAGACANAYNSDILLVACMFNNDPPTGNPYYPAAMPGVMAVGAVQKTGARSGFSEYGNHISVVAPGGEKAEFIEVNLRNILSTACDVRIDTTDEGDDPKETKFETYNWYFTPSYKWWGGTSFAAPFVTGTASLLKGYAKSKGIVLNNDDLRKIIEITASNGYWRDQYTGYGLINARKALDMLNAPWQLVKGKYVGCDYYNQVRVLSGLVPGSLDYLLASPRYEAVKKIKLPRYYTTEPKIWARGAQSRGWSYDPTFSGNKNHCDTILGTLTINGDNVWEFCLKTYTYKNRFGSYVPVMPTDAEFAYTALGIPQPPRMAGISLSEVKTTKAVPGTNYNLWFNWVYAYGCPTLERYEVQKRSDASPIWYTLRSDISPNATGWTIYDFGSVTARLYLRMRAIHSDGYITPWSNTVYIDPPNPDDPIVSETNSTEATAYSNGKKITVGSDGKLHAVFVSGVNVYYTTSIDDGETWSTPIAVGAGKHPAIELTSDNMPTVCWNDVNNLYSSKMVGGSFEEPQLIYTGPEGSEISYLSYVLDQNSNNSYLGWVDEGASGSSVLISTYNPSSSNTLIPTPIDQGGSTAFKSPSLCLDKGGDLKIAWSHTGMVYYKDSGEFTELGQNGIHPIVDAYGDKTSVVWQEEVAPGIYQVVKKTKGINGWSEKQVISYPDGQNADFPVVAAAGQYVYSKNVKDSDYDLIYNCEYDNGWLMGTQNLSGAQGGISRYPSIAFKQEWPKSKLYVLWTEEMPETKSAKAIIVPVVKALTMPVDPVPCNYIDVGIEEYNCYNVQKKGTYYYGPQPEYTIDYHPTELKYGIQNLDPTKKYRIKVVYYQETDASIKQTLSVDNTFNAKSTIKPKAVVTEEHWLPASCVKDGQIEISIAKNVGEYAVCSVIALYEYDRDCDGKSADNITESASRSNTALCYELMQNYPNPHTGNTSIHYQLAQPGKVSLKIYNTLGQVVKTLVFQEQPAGIYNAIWDGRDNSGKAITNGVYFYRLESGDFKATKKMVVLK